MIKITLTEENYKDLVHGKPVSLDQFPYLPLELSLGDVTWGAMMEHMLHAADEQEEMALDALGDTTMRREQIKRAEEKAQEMAEAVKDDPVCEDCENPKDSIWQRATLHDGCWMHWRGSTTPSVSRVWKKCPAKADKTDWTGASWIFTDGPNAGEHITIIEFKDDPKYGQAWIGLVAETGEKHVFTDEALSRDLDPRTMTLKGRGHCA